MTATNRLEVYGGAKELVYDSSFGTTIYTGHSGGSNRGLVIGSGTGGRMRITGGTFSTVGALSPDVAGNIGVAGRLTIDGGAYLATALDLAFNTTASSTGELTLNGGSATIGTLRLGVATSGTALLNLNGGILTVGALTRTAGTSTVAFNGGTLRASADFSSTTGATGNVQLGGAIFDSNGYTMTIGMPLVNNGGGGLTKIGAGTLVLNRTDTYVGPTTISTGALQLGDGALTGSINSSALITIGSAGILDLRPAAGTTVTPAIVGSGVISKSAGGVATITTASGFTGSYDVSVGTLATSAMGNPAQIHISAGATFDTLGTAFTPTQPVQISGNGTLATGGAPFNWNDNVTIAPGNSPGTTLIPGNVLWAGATTGGTYDWQLLSVSGTPGLPGGTPGTDYDTITVGGNLDMTGGGIINIFGIDGADMASIPAGLDLTVKGAKSPLFTILTAGSFTLPPDFSNFQINGGNLAQYGYFTLTQSGNALYLQFTSTVPEPGSWVLLATLLIAVVAMSRTKTGFPISRFFPFRSAR